ncbi:MAG: hypothetical protein A2Y17_13695 [Clostridiales bacterium GWF2_38_85]|nr:MAG: hypothetical protein A2Y17_13695 [Clostridiales bacterium GWF2_38_85]
MIKGLTKKAIIIKCEKESIFEQAILFLKDAENHLEEDQDIVSTANKLIGISEDCQKRKFNLKKQLGKAVLFFYGVITGALIMFCIMNLM